MSLVDTHAHLNDPKFAADVDAVVERADAAGVDAIIVCGYDLESSRAAVELAGRFAGVYATVGVHPHDAKTYGGSAERAIEELSGAPKVLAIGEIGLDFHYDLSPRCAQIAAFESQTDLAAKLGLPIVVHSRESDAEALEVLKGRAGNINGCVFHCFSGDADFARAVLGMGFYIGVDGPITYKTSEKLRGAVEVCPLDRLLVETDCPYLTPVPHRGKRNEPAYVRYVADAAARAKGVTFDELAEATSANARRLFWQKALI